jgi:RimJ/RimL family protein N-acetyltransferase
MLPVVTQPHACLRTFAPEQAAVVASWVRSREELFQLAPSTPPPITADKVRNWTRARGQAFAFHLEPDDRPVGYAELNPMSRDPHHLWIGHVLIDPARRGMGLGRLLARTLVDFAFTQAAAHRLTLVVFPNNLAAVRAYQAAGFAICGEESQRFPTRRGRQRLLRMELTAPAAGFGAKAAP